MRDAETVVFHLRDGRVSVHMQEDGCEIVVHFPDWSGEGGVLGLEINPRRTSASLKTSDLDLVERVGDGIEPAVVRRVGRNYGTYVDYARSVLTWNREASRDSLTALRKAGRTKRGLSADFLSEVADQYRSLVANGEPHPVKALSEIHQTVISNVSHWLAKAERMGLLDRRKENVR